MDIAAFTDQDIEDYCHAQVNKMRDDLWAQRYAARYKAMLEASLENRFAAIEEEMTDADKAEDFPPHASPFPTEAQRKNIQQQKAGISIAIAANQMSGKTTLLLMILEMLADAGALSVSDTRHITSNLGHFLMTKRYVDEDNVEVIDLDIDLNALFAFYDGLVT